MLLADWLALVSVCLLGAMSPGPSLAVVVNATLSGGKRAGFCASVSHGLAVGCYGLLTAAGLAALIADSPSIHNGIELMGAVYLTYLGIQTLRRAGEAATIGEVCERSSSAALEGFTIALLNPKLAIFMLALFSQFVRPDYGAVEKLIMAVTVGATDAAWYILVALLVGRSAFLNRLRQSAITVDRLFAILLILLAASVVGSALYR
ncbi:MAG: LysE family translocator [Pseudomonadota bacterium]